MKKLYLIILACIVLLTGCSATQDFRQGKITHIKLSDNYVVIWVDEMKHGLESTENYTIQRFKDFHRDYYSKVDKQAINLNVLTNRETTLVYSFFIRLDSLDRSTRFKLENLYQAKLYEEKYMVVTFSTRLKPYYYGNGLENIFVDKYKLENPIPIGIAETTEFVETGGGQFLLMLTMPIWVPFALLFGLKV